MMAAGKNKPTAKKCQGKKMPGQKNARAEK